MVRRLFRIVSVAATTLIVIGLTAQLAIAQGGDGGGGGGGTGGTGGNGGFGGSDIGSVPTLDSSLGNTGSNTGSTSNLGSTGSGSNSSGSGPTGLENFFDSFQQDVPEITDLRIRPFVGATAENIGGSPNPDTTPLGFVGSTEEGLLGGARTSVQPLMLQPGEPQNTTGFTVTRKNVRTRLRSGIRVPTVEGEFISTRFQNRLRTLANTQNLGNGYQVSVQNQTAVISGFVNSQDDADRIIGQLRLEPGVYQIVNQLTIGAGNGQ